MRFISKDIETYGVMKLTPAGKDYIKKPTNFPVVKDTEFEEEEEEVGVKNSGGTSATDDVLFSMLKDLRKKLSKKLEVPPFCYFSRSIA